MPGSSATAVLLGVSGLALAWAPSIWAAFVLGVPVGCGGAAFIAAMNAHLQQESPPDMRGRLLALGAVAFLGTHADRCADHRVDRRPHRAPSGAWPTAA